MSGTRLGFSVTCDHQRLRMAQMDFAAGGAQE